MDRVVDDASMHLLGLENDRPSHVAGKQAAHRVPNLTILSLGKQCVFPPQLQLTPSDSKESGKKNYSQNIRVITVRVFNNF